MNTNLQPVLNFYRSTTSFRDPILDAILEMVQPRRIVEVGTTRNLAKFARYSDGWASIRFADYLGVLPEDKDNRPIFYIADLDSVALETVENLSIEHHGSITLKICPDGILAVICAHTNPKIGLPTFGPMRLPQPYDGNILVYLDGANDKWGMKDQLEWCDFRKTSVLCDDYVVKGEGIREMIRFQKENCLKGRRVFHVNISYKATNIEWEGVHNMFFVPSDELIARITLPELEKKLFDLTAGVFTFATE